MFLVSATGRKTLADVTSPSAPSMSTRSNAHPSDHHMRGVTCTHTHCNFRIQTLTMDGWMYPVYSTCVVDRVPRLIDGSFFDFTVAGCCRLAYGAYRPLGAMNVASRASRPAGLLARAWPIDDERRTGWPGSVRVIWPFSRTAKRTTGAHPLPFPPPATEVIMFRTTQSETERERCSKEEDKTIGMPVLWGWCSKVRYVRVAMKGGQCGPCNAAARPWAHESRFTTTSSYSCTREAETCLPNVRSFVSLACAKL